MYLRAAESSAGIFEMDPAQTLAERRQFAPIVDWVRGESAHIGEDELHEVRQIRRLSF
jgi:hypothetical protein